MRLTPDPYKNDRAPAASAVGALDFTDPRKPVRQRKSTANVATAKPPQKPASTCGALWHPR